MLLSSSPWTRRIGRFTLSACLTQKELSACCKHICVDMEVSVQDRASAHDLSMGPAQP